MSPYLLACPWEWKMLPFGKEEVAFWWESELTKNLLLNVLGFSFPLDIRVVIPSEHLSK